VVVSYGLHLLPSGKTLLLVAIGGEQDVQAFRGRSVCDR
jgi:hypothetical protein